MTKFYTYNQNNSGGSFDHQETAGIGYLVFVEAENEREADARAEDIGIYFDGSGDCPCCGNRWSPAWEGDGHDKPSEYGEEWRACETGEEPTLDWGIPCYIHFADGTFKPARKV